jgi:hypothetical protein
MQSFFIRFLLTFTLSVLRFMASDNQWYLQIILLDELIKYYWIEDMCKM